MSNEEKKELIENLNFIDITIFNGQNKALKKAIKVIEDDYETKFNELMKQYKHLKKYAGDLARKVDI